MATFQNLFDRVQDMYASATDAKAVREYVRIINTSLRTVVKEWEWSYLIREGSINFEPFVGTDTGNGTASMANGAQIITLTGGTWPANAATAPYHVVLDVDSEVEFEIATRDSNTQVTVRSDQEWLQASVVDGGYRAYRRTYDLPTDFRKFYYGESEDLWWIEELTPSQFASFLLRQNDFTGDPRFMTITQGNRLKVWPYPNEARRFDFLYLKWPTVLADDLNNIADEVEFDPQFDDVLFGAQDIEIARSWGSDSPLTINNAVGNYHRVLMAAKRTDQGRMHRHGRRFGMGSGLRRRGRLPGQTIESV